LVGRNKEKGPHLDGLQKKQERAVKKKVPSVQKIWKKGKKPLERARRKGAGKGVEDISGLVGKGWER